VTVDTKQVDIEVTTVVATLVAALYGWDRGPMPVAALKPCGRLQELLRVEEVERHRRVGVVIAAAMKATKAVVLGDPETSAICWRAFVDAMRNDTEIREQVERGAVDWDRLAFVAAWGGEPPSA